MIPYFEYISQHKHTRVHQENDLHNVTYLESHLFLIRWKNKQ